MKNSLQELVRRTGGRGTMQSRAAAHSYTFNLHLDQTHQIRLKALEAFNGRGYFRMPWEGASFGLLDGKPVNTGIFGVLRRRSPIGVRCGAGGIEQLCWRTGATTINHSEAANDSNHATQSEWGIAA